VAANRDWSDDTGNLRRFGLALTRDDRYVPDDAAAARLVDKLIRQTSVAIIAEPFGGGLGGRVRAFARFILLYRRHVRRMALEDIEGAWVEPGAAAGRGPPNVAAGVRALPLELRETILLVVVAGFSHREAAEALDIPLTCFYDRLTRARERVAAHLDSFGGEPPMAWRGAPHLRVIK
jgi:predicted DNA-binding protein (UPF0251 family)